QVREGVADVAGRIDAEVLARRVVAPLDAFALDDHHAVGQGSRRIVPARERAGEPGLAARSLALRAVQERVQLVPRAAGARLRVRLAALQPRAQRIELAEVVGQ